jgi:hypothetical protein
VKIRKDDKWSWIDIFVKKQRKTRVKAYINENHIIIAHFFIILEGPDAYIH